MQNNSESESEWQDERVEAHDSSDNDDAAALAASDGSGADDGDHDAAALELSAHAIAQGTAHEMAARLTTLSCCASKCLERKKRELNTLVGSMWRMTKQERRCSMLTGLAVCEAILMDPKTTSKGGERQRVRFNYVLPFIGKVCKVAYLAVHDTSHRSLVLARKQVKEGDISARQHGNSKNTHAAVHDPDALVDWFRSVASEIGEVVPLRVRIAKKEGGKLVRYYSFDDVTLLPASLTWAQLHGEYQTYVDDPTARMPSLSSFTSILKKHCPDVRIRSPREQVCDVCSIYQVRSHSGAQDEIEMFAEHVMDARAMR